jgi:hypothetical protein
MSLWKSPYLILVIGLLLTVAGALMKISDIDLGGFIQGFGGGMSVASVINIVLTEIARKKKNIPKG